MTNVNAKLDGAFSRLYLRSFRIEKNIPPEEYYAKLPVIQHIQNSDGFTFTKPITFFVGENGIGKSSVIEALAINAGFNPEGGTLNFSFSTRDSHSSLYEYLRIARGIRKLQPVEHRLQLIPNPGGITLIDDAFNSNIRGAEQAFKVLGEMPGTRIAITPGMVELGKLEYEMNRQFGEAMAHGCDVAVLVGKKRSEAIREGLLNAGFAPENIHVADTLDDASAFMRSVVKPGDTVLFENDLPDNYTE